MAALRSSMPTSPWSSKASPGRQRPQPDNATAAASLMMIARCYPRAVYMRLVLLLGIVFLVAAAAQQQEDQSIWRRWQNEKKLIVVTTPDWNAVEGTLIRYERRGREWI